MAARLVEDKWFVGHGSVEAVHASVAKAKECFFHEFGILGFELGAFGIVVAGGVNELEHATGGGGVKPGILVHQVLEYGAAYAGKGALEEDFFYQFLGN